MPRVRKTTVSRSGIQPKPLIELHPTRHKEIEQLERIANQHGLTATELMLQDVDKLAAWCGLTFKEAARALCRSINRQTQPPNSVLYPEKPR